MILELTSDNHSQHFSFNNSFSVSSHLQAKWFPRAYGTASVPLWQLLVEHNCPHLFLWNWIVCASTKCSTVYTLFITSNLYWHFFFFFLRMWRLTPIVGQPGSSSSISRMKLGQTTIQLGKRAGFDDVGHHLGLTTEAQISVCKTPCLSTGTAMPLTGAETVQERPLLSW